MNPFEKLAEPGPEFIAFLEACSIPELLKLGEEMRSIPEDAQFLEAVKRIVQKKALEGA